jgi:hypothetical protein
MELPADSTVGRRAALGPCRGAGGLGPTSRGAPAAGALGLARGLCLAGALGLVGATTRAAQAAPPAGGKAGAESARVRARYRAALDAFEAGRFEEALAAFNDVAAEKEAAVVFYYRGACRARLGQWVQAEEDFARAVTLSVNRPDADNKYVFAESQKAMREVDEHLAEVALAVRPVGPEALPEVTLDGVSLPSYAVPQRNRDRVTWGPIRIVKGEHAFAVTYPGRTPLRASFVAPDLGESKGGVQMVRLAWPEAPPRPEARPAPPPKVEPSPDASPAGPWAFGAGVGLGAASLGLFAAHLAGGRNAAGDTPYLVPAVVAGGGALVAGALGWVLTSSSRHPSVAGGGNTSARATRVAPLVVPLGAGVAFTGELW